MRFSLRGNEAQSTEHRNKLLSASDWVVIRHRDQLELGQETSLTQEQYEAVLTYRQILRDWDKISVVPALPDFLQ